MRKVLIICDLFPPAFGPRMGYLAKYLKAYGWQAVVVTEKTEERTFEFMSDECEVKTIEFYRNDRFGKLRWFFVFLGEILFKYKTRKVYKAAMRLVRTHSFELVLCSTFRTFPLTAAKNVAADANLPLVVDIRDIIEQFSGYEFISQPLPDIPFVRKIIASAFRYFSLKERNKTLRAADRVITISPWHVEVLKRYNKDVTLIYNGYDPELFFPAPVKSPQFIISYTGRLLSLSMRNPDLFLKGLKRLADEGVVAASDCRVEWYVDEASETSLREESGKYGLLEFMDFKGYVPATRIPGILNRSSILLLLTNKADKNGPKGVMTTKFFEFLAVEKPILCVRSDEGCLEQVIRETNSGLAARNEDEVYTFIKEQYAEWKKNGSTHAETVREKAIVFSRKEQASQFICIFGQVLKKH